MLYVLEAMLLDFAMEAPVRLGVLEDDLVPETPLDVEDEVDKLAAPTGIGAHSTNSLAELVTIELEV